MIKLNIRIIIALCLLATTAATVACISRQKAITKAEQALAHMQKIATNPGGFEFLGESIISKDDPNSDWPMGGISGLTFAKEQKYFVAVSDDRSQKGPARLFHFALNWINEKPEFKPIKTLPLISRHKSHFATSSIDAEGLARLKNGDLYIASEGDQTVKPVVPSMIFRASNTGQWLGDVPLAKTFWPGPLALLSHGLRNNKSFESLSVSADATLLYAAPEQALRQDGPEADLDHSAPLRFAEFSLSGHFPTNNAQFVYVLSPIAQDHGHRYNGDTGLSDFLALSNRRFVTVERSWLAEVGFAVIRLYLADCTQASNVRDFPQLAGNKWHPCKKDLLIDLGVIVDKIADSPGVQKIDNIEAISWGPTLADGSVSLILASDDNFSADQKNQFLVFRWPGNLSR